MQLIRSISPGSRFYIALAFCVLVFLLSFSYPALFLTGIVLLALSLVLSLIDVLLLFQIHRDISAQRMVQRIMSLGSTNQISIRIHNSSKTRLFTRIIDELPFQLQCRDFCMKAVLEPNHEIELNYQIRPLLRGVYGFGNIRIQLNSRLGLMNRALNIPAEISIPVFPSVMEMKRFEISTFGSRDLALGVRRIRRVGHSYEFEKIKEYERGDEYRSINWRASGRKAQLMVNQYEQEKSQQVYCIIDAGRNMLMPFDGLSLLDHAVNASLALSNIVLKKKDRAGLIVSYAHKVNITPAERNDTQLRRIMESLYAVELNNLESNHELLYTRIRDKISRRSLMFYFSNFESIYAIERLLPILRQLNRLHLLVVVFFENTEVGALAEGQTHEIKGIYEQGAAMAFTSGKWQILDLIRKYGIQAIYTKPEQLSAQSINKYLELKSRGLI